MTIAEAKNISIKEFLSEIGIEPAQNRGGYGMYNSPLRNENTPSFKVDYQKNLWYDFGTSEGGTFIDLVMKMQECDFISALRHIEENMKQGKFSSSFSFHRKDNQPTVSKIEITEVAPLTNPALLSYTKERAIPVSIIKDYCKEVNYKIGDKNYFAIGFKNDDGGWELRNKYFKGGTSPKGITTIKNGSDSCLIFEGFMDALSFLVVKNITYFRQNVIVLNSVTNLAKAEKFIISHNKIYTFLDNDEAGKQALEKIKKLGIDVIDQSPFYQKAKDLNGYLTIWQVANMQRKIVRQKLR